MQYYNHNVSEPIQCVRTSEYFHGAVNSLVRHIVCSESRGKVVKVDICCAQSLHGAACSRL